MTVKSPSRNTAGITVETKGMNMPRDCDMNPLAARELDKESTYRELRAEASEIVELALIVS